MSAELNNDLDVQFATFNADTQQIDLLISKKDFYHNFNEDC